MTELEQIKAELDGSTWFQKPGAYVLVDGQYGSTGKGAVAAMLAQLYGRRVNIATTNAGPNSGHTGYYAEYEPSTDNFAWKKVLTQQLPVFAAVVNRLGGGVIGYLNGGAVIKPPILLSEQNAYGMLSKRHVHGILTHLLWVHPNAAVIDHDYETDGADSTDKIASTNKGVGRAIARKVMREDNVVKSRLQDFDGRVWAEPWPWDWDRDVVFVETAQGFSLGINQPFYPYTTSRECTVQQAIADANIPYNQVRKVIMSVRTYPIRVGNTAVGTSGDCYPDQQETSWAEIGVPQELTTVTKRVRRVFTWSEQQFIDALRANQPDVLVINFLDYLPADRRQLFIDIARIVYEKTLGRRPDAIIGGYGPYPSDMKLEG